VANKTSDISPGFTKVYIANEYKTGGSEVRLIGWWVNGKATPIRFERRDYFLDQQSRRRTGKVRGFTEADLEWLEKNLPQVRADMAQGLKEMSVAPESNAGGDDETPF